MKKILKKIFQVGLFLWLVIGISSMLMAQAKMPREFQILTVRTMQVGESGYFKSKALIVNEKGLCFLNTSTEIDRSYTKETWLAEYDWLKITREADGYVVTLLKRPTKGWSAEYVYAEKSKIDLGELIPIKAILQSF
jgi:hypothetical protein